ncbi:G5 domain-containing protein [Gemella sp. GH3]|uniref:GAG-binding domain-containing protein n=1 Tax=unclassified Gemella TaxID=2624949 RepID=UPI0015D088E0|nr:MULTISPECIES: GAG-binding domain-containing protein [unclassified Gemella]MBF0714554.1 G5 domain-containing protein [Gemella sp. GH3.1]NYS51506.1 G5 domain-containing protein [Gemella sp. GH3]
MIDSKKDKVLKYSIRKKKLGVGSITIATMLLATGIPSFHNVNNIATAEEVTQSKVDEYRQIYNKIKELVDVDYGYYASIIGDAPGDDLTMIFENKISDEKKMNEALLNFVNYGLIIDSNGYKQFKNIDEYKPFLERDYAAALKQAKEEKKSEFDKYHVSKEIKGKYKELLDKESSLTKVTKEIPEAFAKEIAQMERSELYIEIDKAKDEIQKMNYLKDKGKYIKQLENISSKDEIKNILAQAKEEAEKDRITFESVEKVRKQIQNLKYLTDEQRSTYNGILDNSNEAEANKLLEEADLKNRKEFINIMKATIDKAEESLSNVDKLKTAPDTEDYELQHDLWYVNFKTGIRTINGFYTEIVDKPESKKLSLLEKINKDLNDFIRQAKIEELTRIIAKYRQKYPGNENIEKYFNDYLKQTKASNHASLEGIGLENYVDRELVPKFNDLKRIINNLEKKAEVLNELDKLIKDLEQKPLSSEIVSSLKKQKGIIELIGDDQDGLAETYFGYAKKEIAEYEKEYNSYKAELEKSKEEINNLISKLPTKDNEKAKELATKLMPIAKELEGATLSGDTEYKTFMPKIVNRIREEVEKFIKDNEKQTLPLTPLTPAVVESVETEISKVEYSTIEVENSELEVGVSQVKTEGVNGERTLKYKVRKKGNEILSKELISNEVTKNPVNKVIEIGTKKPEVKPMPEKPKMEDNVKPMPEKPKVEDNVKPMPEKPKMEDNVKPMPEKPKMEDNVKPMPEKPKVEDNVKPMPEKPKMEDNVKPMPEKPKMEDNVKPMPEKPKMEDEVKPMPEKPKVEDNVKPMPEKPKMEDEVKPMPEKPKMEDNVKPMPEKPKMEDKKSNPESKTLSNKTNNKASSDKKKLSNTGVSDNVASYVVAILALLLSSVIAVYRKIIK